MRCKRNGGGELDLCFLSAVWFDKKKIGPELGHDANEFFVDMQRTWN